MANPLRQSLRVFPVLPDRTYFVRSLRTLVLTALTGALVSLAAAQQAPLPFVSPMFGDHMVLQRGKANTIWGWTTPGKTVRVEIAGRSASGVAGADGRWVVRIEQPGSAGPHVLEISGPQAARFGNVLVGDVWLCGGQSNMELPLNRTRGGDAAITAAIVVAGVVAVADIDDAGFQQPVAQYRAFALAGGDELRSTDAGLKQPPAQVQPKGLRQNKIDI